ncbi:MAG: queuosine precursor transporter [Candidatus Lokiarchaeota archaeon]|nr:queuosine precursor transporter [Candidatus Lokiarchaeota archaeon]
MWLVLLIWVVVIFVSTLVISQYMKMQKREDVAIAFYILFITMSQILAVKIGDFSLGSYQITAPVAVLIFPFTFQITDMVNENFGRKRTHRMIFIAFVTQILMAVFIWFSIEIPGAPFWGLNWGSNPTEAQNFWLNFFGSTIRITIASWISFIITENLDAVLFAKLKKLTGGKNLWIRNIFSDIPTLALDSLIFVSIAFGGLLDIWPIIWGQLLTKWFFGVIDTPFMYLSRGIINGKINILGNLFGKHEENK